MSREHAHRISPEHCDLNCTTTVTDTVKGIHAPSHEDNCGVKALLHVFLISERDGVSRIGCFIPGKVPPVPINGGLEGQLWRRKEFHSPAGNWIGRSCAPVQALRRRHLSYDVRGRSQTRPCGRPNGRSVIGTGFYGECFCFPLLVSFHHCSILFHSPTTDVWQSRWKRHFIKLLCLFLSWSFSPHPTQCTCSSQTHKGSQVS